MVRGSWLCAQKSKDMKQIITLIGLYISALGVYAQDTAATKADADTMQVRPFQISFVPPMSTNGLESPNIVNRVSVNIFAGYNGGTNGAEFSGFVAVDKKDVTGGQFSGFGNIVGGNTKGVQAGGFFNITRGSFEGAQLAGFHNYASDTLKGMQAAGFNNVLKGSMQGTQLAGFANVATKKSVGFQGAGFVNTVRGNLTGTQAAGFCNVATDTIIGGQAAGYVNYAKQVRGPQVSGFVNVASGGVDGVQISGFVNYATSVKGIQIGFLNLADTVDGVSIGFLSLVRKGYHKFELKTSETLHLMGNFKTGTHRFYNIFSAGVNFGSRLRWAYGYGAGTYVPFSEKLGLNVDVTAYHINEEEAWTDELNLLNRLDADMVFRFGKNFELAVGPSMNVLVSHYFDNENNQLGSDIAPYSFYNRTTNGGTNIKMWVGGNLAVRF